MYEFPLDQPVTADFYFNMSMLLLSISLYRDKNADDTTHFQRIVGRMRDDSEIAIVNVWHGLHHHFNEQMQD